IADRIRSDSDRPRDLVCTSQSPRYSLMTAGTELASGLSANVPSSSLGVIAMADESITGKRIAFLATCGVEQAELTEPWKAVKDAGAKPELVSLKSGEIQ